VVLCDGISITVVPSDEQQNLRREIMSATKAKTQTPVEMPNTVPAKEYRLTREDYPELQRARSLVKLQKLKTIQYTNDQGLQDIRIVYQLRDTTFTAETLTAWGKAIGEQILAKIEAWTPNQSVYALSEMLSTMKFCDPSLEVDLTTLPTEKIDKKLKDIIVIQDSAGWGINKSGVIVNCDGVLAAISEGEKLGMKFVKE
jgi:hypothetical protein